MIDQPARIDHTPINGRLIVVARTFGLDVDARNE